MNPVLNRPGYFSGTQATGAGVDPAGRPIHDCLNPHHVGLPGPVRTTVGVGNLDTELNLFTADFTFCHGLHLL